ncbi:Fph type histidine kinase [Athelia psychrophila]|uniref:Fph type histidine kinase n=1 Tax=Athelia psychrophila TaxID=1759441 RepID=A0A167VNQ9_9AGAM|nr:Fph type histidine kinase [Fibularhizoctonia sp. CBS 109695]
MMDVFAVMTQINEQLDAVPDLEQFLKVVAGVIKDLSQFHRVMVYQFDELWNGQVVAELVDWNQTHDLFQGLHFPASDIPAQARQLYAINKVRLLYDREQPTARIIVRNKDDLETPLNMTHCYLRAMSPIHIKYLGNMGVRASMSVSIMGFGQLWGLIACHSYGTHRMRVSFPVRQMLRLLCQSISRNIERLSYAQRLQTRKLINTMSSENHPTGQIVSNADELLGLFEADYGILVIGEGAKILGPNIHGQDILVMAEYLRLKQFDTIQVSQSVVKDFPDLELSTGLSVVAGLLYVPLSSGGKDFIAFLRKGQMKEVHWAGRPENKEASGGLEPRKSFKIWSEMVSGRSRSWTDEHMETAGVLALVYGKFIEVWRQKESALQTTRLTNILLSNASHEVRTPLNHIINYLEMALDGPLDDETRENLSMSHAASKSLLFTINDLLDLTRLESGHETSLNEAFDLQAAIEEATRVYKNEASRRNIEFALDVTNSPQMVIGDVKKIKTVVANLTANSLKYTKDGSITVQCRTFGEPEGLRAPKQTAVEIVVADSGCGIPSDKLESIFREFEQVESSAPRTTSSAGLGLGLAVVARIVEQLGGQLRVDSKVNQGSQFSFLIPLALPGSSQDISSPTGSRHSGGSSHFLNPDRASSRDSVAGSAGSDINSLVEALQSNHMASPKRTASPGDRLELPSPTSQAPTAGKVDVVGSATPMRPIKIEMDGPDVVLRRPPAAFIQPAPPVSTTEPLATLIAAPIVTDSTASSSTISNFPDFPKLRVLVVEDNDINRKVLAKRLSNLGHTVVNTTNGQECLDTVQHDREYDCVLMDIQMPIMNGNDATVGIRKLEQDSPPPSNHPTRHRASQELNGRIPIFAVSASLYERNLDYMIGLGMDGWILKPISFKRLDVILRGITDASQRDRDVYHPGCSWELGGWFTKCSTTSS